MPKTSSKPKAEYEIQTVANALRMLEVFHTETEIGVSDLSRRLKLHKNNAFRLLATLELAGYIQQSPDSETYRLGPSCLELGQAYLRSYDLVEQARPFLKALSVELGETAHVASMGDDDVVHLDGILPSQLILTGTRIGERLPLHCTSLGKVLLAGRFDSTTESLNSGKLTEPGVTRETGEGRNARGTRVLSDRVLARLTPSTIVDPAKFVEELSNVAIRGYAVDNEEYASGLCCVAAPVRDATSKVVAALSISGPSFRLSESMLHREAGHAVMAAAEQLSVELGDPA